MYLTIGLSSHPYKLVAKSGWAEILELQFWTGILEILAKTVSTHLVQEPNVGTVICDMRWTMSGCWMQLLFKGSTYWIANLQGM